MTQQIINVGNKVNDGTGDPLRIAFQKINNNFTTVFTGGAAALGWDFGSIIPQPISTPIEYLMSLAGDIDMGTITAPAAIDIDVGTIV